MSSPSREARRVCGALPSGIAPQQARRQVGAMSRSTVTTSAPHTAPENTFERSPLAISITPLLQREVRHRCLRAASARAAGQQRMARLPHEPVDPHYGPTGTADQIAGRAAHRGLTLAGCGSGQMRWMVDTSRRHPLPRRLTVSVRQAPLSQAVIRTAAPAIRMPSRVAPLARARMGVQGGVAARGTLRGLHPLCRKGFRSAPINAPRRALCKVY